MFLSASKEEGNSQPLCSEVKSNLNNKEVQSEINQKHKAEKEGDKLSKQKQIYIECFTEHRHELAENTLGILFKQLLVEGKYD